MTSLASSIAIGIVVFASTNIDDIFLLSAFFADRQIKRRSVVIGQFAGIAVLVLASIIAALLALSIPEGWIALLGVVPLMLGIAKLRGLFRSNETHALEDETHHLQEREHHVQRSLHSQILAVAAVTIANGGDNLGVYIPLFSRAPNRIILFVSIFISMTALWCLCGYMLVNNRYVGGLIRRYGHTALPFVLMGLGLYILWDARLLLS